MLLSTSAEQVTKVSTGAACKMPTSKISPKPSTTCKMNLKTPFPPNLMKQAQDFRKSFQVKNDTGVASRTMQKHLIVEEFKEFLEAEQLLLKDFTRNKEDCLKELADLVYVCYQYAANMGWDLDEAMDRVHKSNMSKLDDNGQPIFREDGKVLKSSNYQPPTLTDLV